MKIFNRDGKVNFIDKNNVLVGFDYVSCCCENFGYFLTPTKPTSLDPIDVLQESDEAFSGFVFDTKYCDDIAFGGEWNDSSASVFRLTRGDETIFLTLHNTHNGYYGHGFDMTLDGARLHSGCL